MIKTGPKNSILDVGGLGVGQAHDVSVKTGVSVIIPDAPARCSVDVRGGGPGTREIMALCEGGLIERVHAIVLSGGSVYGLAAADSVTAWLGEQGRGYKAYDGVPVSPIVPAAILFDNANGGDKDWGLNPPFRQLGIQACEGMSDHLSEGAFGAGFGAMAGIYPGGIGSASEIVGGITIGALIAANPIGSPYMPNSAVPWAWPYEAQIKAKPEFGGARPSPDYQLQIATDTKLGFLKAAGQSTVIGAIATDADLSKTQLKRLAMMAQDGIAMAVQPSHTPLDGDTIFALSTAASPDGNNDSNNESDSEISPAMLAHLGAAAAHCTARALMRAVYFAKLDN